MILIYIGKKRKAERHRFMGKADRLSEIKGRLNIVFQEVFEDYEIQIFDEMTAEDIEEWDSLMHIALVVTVEKEFNMQLNAAEIGQLENVGAMIELIDQRSAG